MKKSIVLVVLLAAFATNSFAQLESSSSMGLRYVIPTGTTGDVYESGWGVVGTTNFKVIPLLSVAVTGSWTSLQAKELTADESGNITGLDDLSIIGFTAGPVLNLGFIDIGVKGGYYFDDIHEWVILPFAQVDIWLLSLGAEYKAFDQYKWYSAYLVFNF